MRILNLKANKHIVCIYNNKYNYSFEINVVGTKSFHLVVFSGIVTDESWMSATRPIAVPRARDRSYVTGSIHRWCQSHVKY